jgi:hypothetical protein
MLWVPPVPRPFFTLRETFAVVKIEMKSQHIFCAAGLALECAHAGPKAAEIH